MADSRRAGQVGATDRATIFGLLGPVQRLTESEIPAPRLPRMAATCAVIGFKPDGNRIDHTRFDGRGRIVSRYEYRYDEQGRRMGPLFFTGDPGTLDHEIRFEYDATGMRRARQEQWDATGRLMFTLHFGYNVEGGRAEQRWIGADGRLIRTYHTTYDEAGNRTAQVSTDAEGRIEWRLRAAYDRAGRLRWTIRRVPPFGLSIELLHYGGADAHGNWTRAIRWRGFVARRVIPVVTRERIERRLEYFPEPAAPTPSD